MSDATRWLATDAADPGSLAAERLQLHYGAWILASVAHSLLPARDDDSHSNLGVDPAGTSLETWPLDAEGSIRMSLELGNLELVLHGGDEVRARLALAGKTFDDALEWANGNAPAHARLGAVVRRREFPDFPDHAIASGAPFDTGDRTRREVLGRWFANGRSSLTAMLSGETGADPLRVWPHHFDLGSLIPRGGSGDDARSIGIGLSPGDESYAEPYFYVSPWPHPAPADLPDLPAPGAWHTQGFTSAVLVASRIPAPAGASTAAFLRAALNACRALTA